jgi:hypothetical protein
MVEVVEAIVFFWTKTLEFLGTDKVINLNFFACLMFRYQCFIFRLVVKYLNPNFFACYGTDVIFFIGLGSRGSHFLYL